MNGYVSELAGRSDTTLPTFKLAWLQATPHCMDWSTVGLLNISDNEIVPNGVYEIQAIDCACDPGLEANYSAALTVAASKWGDLVESTNAQPADGITDFNDISAVVDKFRNLESAPTKARTDVAPDAPDGAVDFVDISSLVDAFRGRSYPYGGPDECN